MWNVYGGYIAWRDCENSWKTRVNAFSRKANWRDFEHVHWYPLYSASPKQRVDCQVAKGLSLLRLTYLASRETEHVEELCVSSMGFFVSCHPPVDLDTLHNTSVSTVENSLNIRHQCDTIKKGMWNVGRACDENGKGLSNVPSWRDLFGQQQMREHVTCAVSQTIRLSHDGHLSLVRDLYVTDIWQKWFGPFHFHLGSSRSYMVSSFEKGSKDQAFRVWLYHHMFQFLGYWSLPSANV